RTIAAGLVLLAGVAGLCAVPQLGHVSERNPGEGILLAAAQPWALAAGIVAVAAGALALMHARQLRRDLGVLTLAIAGFAATQLIMASLEPYGKMRAGKDLAAKILPELQPGTTLYAVELYEQSLTFYLRHTMILVAYLDE